LAGLFYKLTLKLPSNRTFNTITIAYRADLQAQGVDLSPFIRYDISRIKMKANDILTSSETTTDEAIALGIDILKLPSNSTFNTITMRFIVSRLNAFITNRSGGVVFLIIQPQFHHHLLLGIFTAMDFLPVLLTVRIYKLRVLIYRLSFVTTSAVSR
jgi:hypothetical protein